MSEFYTFDQLSEEAQKVAVAEFMVDAVNFDSDEKDLTEEEVYQLLMKERHLYDKNGIVLNGHY